MQIKDVISKFEVSRATLHNWKTTKPNLYNYLLNYNSKNELEKIQRDTKLVFEEYAKSNIKPIFTFNEIKFIYDKKLVLENFEDIKNIALIYASTISKDMNKQTKFVLDIYYKLDNLNIIEKYLFSSRLETLSQKNIKNIDDILRHYMKEFIL